MRRKTLQADIGRALGISRQRVHALAKRGMPVDSIEKARQWRAENLDADAMRPAPGTAKPASGEMAELKRRLLAAEAGLREQKLANFGGTLLPSAKVERAYIGGLQMLRASFGGGISPIYEHVASRIGEDAAREMFNVLQEWWGGVYNCAADAIMLGLQMELPGWGHNFRTRWIAMERGNFPDVPVPGEPRALEDVKRAAAAAGEADGDA